MVLFSIVLFAISLVLIAGLFTVKYWECEHNVVLAASWRIRSDRQAIRLKRRISQLGDDIARLWPVVLLFLRYVIHEAALGFASFARTCERQAHKIADLVSHRRTFVPREPRSEFLKQVIEHKTGNGESGTSHV